MELIHELSSDGSIWCLSSKPQSSAEAWLLLQSRSVRYIQVSMQSAAFPHSKYENVKVATHECTAYCTNSPFKCIIAEAVFVFIIIFSVLLMTNHGNYLAY